MNHYNGSSSLLFIISAIKSLYVSNIVLWKLSTVMLVFASYLCNASNYNETWLMFDYVTIYLIAISYINSWAINGLLTGSLILEYNYSKDIANTKNVALFLVGSKAIIYTYLYVDTFYFYSILASSVAGVAIYNYRVHLHNQNIKTYTLFLTWCLHACVANVIYVTAITA